MIYKNCLGELWCSLCENKGSLGNQFKLTLKEEVSPTGVQQRRYYTCLSCARFMQDADYIFSLDELETAVAIVFPGDRTDNQLRTSAFGELLLNHFDEQLGRIRLFHETKLLTFYLRYNLPLPAPVSVWFGVDSDIHYQALKTVSNKMEAKMSLRDLAWKFNEGYNFGTQLSVLVSNYAPEFTGICFETPTATLCEQQRQTKAKSNV